ncbi:MAG: hypothetical protein GY851_06285 [bacterium]|nr:hypothetical protein [bacterium]
MNDSATRSRGRLGLVFRLLGGLLVGASLALVLYSWIVFFALPEEAFGQGEERGLAALLLIVYGIPAATILGAVVGLLASLMLRKSRVAGWATAIACCILAVTGLAAFLWALGFFEQWMEGG